MSRRADRQSGFTIVELLIVIVVIGILAAITIVAYNGVQDRANRSLVQQELRSADSQLKKEYVDGNDLYPEDIEEMRGGLGLAFNQGATLYYTPHNDVQPRGYCLTAELNGVAYFINEGSAPTEGYCPEHDPNIATDAPTIITTPNSQTQITVSWEAIEDATSYRLEWSASAGFSPMTTVSNITGVSQAVGSLSSGTTYYFRLYAINSANIVSSPSAVVSDTTQAAAPAGAPTITATANSTTQITIARTVNVAGATSYTLQRAKSNTFPVSTDTVSTSGITAASTAVTGLTPGTRYYFRMLAVSGGGNGPNSNTVNAITTISAPDSPTVAVTIPGDARAYSSGTWAKSYDGDPTSGTWYYAKGAVSSSTCASNATRQQRARVQYNSPTTWGAWSSWTTSSSIYAIGPLSGYGIRFQVQTRCYTSVYTSAASSSGYGCRWRSGSTTCSGF